MSLLTKASTVTTPTAYSRGQLHSVKPEVVENILTYSNTFDNVIWAGTATWTSGQADKDGGTNAWLFAKSAASSSDYYNDTTINGVQTFSIYAKKQTGVGLKIYFFGSSNGFATFNLENGSVYNSSGSIIIDTNVETYNSQWWRLSVTINGTSGNWYLYTTDGTDTQTTDVLTLQDAQLNKGYTALQYIETTTSALPSADFDFARASSATRVNEQGYIEDVPYNLVQQSNTFDTTWINYLTTETGGQADKDGGTSAWQIDKTGASGSIYQTAVIRGVQTFSVYAKKGTLDWVRLTFLGTSNAFFDLANGVVGSTSGALAVSSDIVSVGDGWYRINFVSDNVSTTGVSIIPAESDGVISGTSGNIYIQDAQLVKGSDAKDYLETTDRQDIPRINYEGGNGHFLLEPQRTNLVTYSEDFENGWSLQTGIDVSNNETTSLEGNTNATKIETTAAGARYVGNNYTLATGDNTFSVFAKKGTTNWIYLNVYQDAFNNFNYSFDLENGVLGQSNSSAYTVTASIQDYGDGWYRITAKANVTSSGTYTARIYPADSATDVSTDIGDSVYIYGAQLEAGSYATSYIPTFGSAVTRAAETCNNAGNSDLFNDSEGVLYAEIKGYENDAISRPISINDGGTSDRVQIFFPSTQTQVYGRITSGGATTADMIGTLTQTIFNKIALKYKVNDFALWINGVEVVTDSSGAVPSGLSTISFNNGSTTPFYGKTKMVSTFTEALSDSELECLTSWSSFNRMATAQNYNIE